ncbi:hypothetical protein ABG79_01712 [Caloramator mitchellensis]|uniref:Uncharacterized protein n=1 Tax=Caloramator mitchellensis TaxID=908809 RepID=A0A0R3JSL7_CALMK|nr:hypothetical protein [Caloramator mitchellensis]KRQ86503.1 hypothetical protein ABG79_01712 [Caloramator mitchellensis]
MAIRLYFVAKPFEGKLFEELEIEFKYYNGFSITQKQKSIISMHEKIYKKDPTLQVLEISSKSNNPLGVALSAFNLKVYDEKIGKEYPLENIFQSSKVFELGGPYRDLLNVSPKDAKKDPRLRESGELIYFDYDNVIWEKEPKTMFYDWLYINALYRNKYLSKEILKYNAFTDIEFNHEKSFNCQARAAAIFVGLNKIGKIKEIIDNKDEFKKIYIDKKETNEQLTMNL